MTLTTDVAATLQPGFPGTDLPEWLVRAHAEGLVSVCLYGDNVTGPGGVTTGGVSSMTVTVCVSCAVLPTRSVTV